MQTLRVQLPKHGGFADAGTAFGYFTIVGNNLCNWTLQLEQSHVYADGFLITHERNNLSHVQVSRPERCEPR